MMEDGEHPDSPFPGINFKCAISLMSNCQRSQKPNATDCRKVPN